MNLWVWEHCALSNQMFDTLSCLTPLPLLFSYKILFPVVGLKMSAVALKSRNRFFVRYSNGTLFSAFTEHTVL